MRNRIINYTSELSKITDYIRNDLVKYFSHIDYSVPNKEIQIIEINNEADLNKIIYGIGFYTILTDHEFDNNECRFEYKNLKAIYRGHSYFTKKRLLSHLANKKYKLDRKRNDPNYQVCLKIDNKVNGINLDNNPYNKWKWIVIIHKMNKSSKLMREQAEFAFDEIYNKPCKSRE